MAYSGIVRVKYIGGPEKFQGRIEEISPAVGKSIKVAFMNRPQGAWLSEGSPAFPYQTGHYDIDFSDPRCDSVFGSYYPAFYRDEEKERLKADLERAERQGRQQQATIRDAMRLMDEAKGRRDLAIEESNRLRRRIAMGTKVLNGEPVA